MSSALFGMLNIFVGFYHNLQCICSRLSCTCLLMYLIISSIWLTILSIPISSDYLFIYSNYSLKELIIFYKHVPAKLSLSDQLVKIMLFQVGLVKNQQKHPICTINYLIFFDQIKDLNNELRVSFQNNNKQQRPIREIFNNRTRCISPSRTNAISC